jgi:hypothetical protein
MSDRGGFRKRRARFVAAALLALVVGACSGERGQNRDPLLGGLNVPSAKRGRIASRGLDKPLPLTAPTGSTSAANLASSGGTKGAPEGDAASWRGSSPTGVTLGPPGPISGKPSPPSMPPPGGDSAGGTLIQAGGTVTTDHFIDETIRGLELRGMKGFRLDQDRAAAEPRAAVRAVLDKVESEGR